MKMFQDYYKIIVPSSVSYQIIVDDTEQKTENLNTNTSLQ